MVYKHTHCSTGHNRRENLKAEDKITVVAINNAMRAIICSLKQAAHSPPTHAALSGF
jgi:hypothetical protein